MRQIVLNIVILTLLCSSCAVNAQNPQDELLKIEINELVEELKLMYDYDQAIREYAIFKTFDKHLTDSIENLSKNLTKDWIRKNEFQNEKLAKQILEHYTVPLDNRHTERLIEITKKYGFPSRKRIEKFYTNSLPEEFNPYIIFVHSQPEYWEELKSLMEKELEKGNITNCVYGHLLWHINGRSDFKYMLDNGYEFIETEDGSTHLKAVNCE